MTIPKRELERRLGFLLERSPQFGRHVTGLALTTATGSRRRHWQCSAARRWTSPPPASSPSLLLHRHNTISTLVKINMRYRGGRAAVRFIARDRTTVLHRTVQLLETGATNILPGNLLLHPRGTGGGVL